MDKLAAVKFLIADDHPLFRKGLAGFLTANFPNCTIKEASNGEEVLNTCKADRFDLIFMDLRMPNITGMEATRQLMKSDPLMNVIGISMHDDETHIVNMMECGARGFIAKNDEDDEMLEAIDKVLDGVIYISKKKFTPALWNRLMEVKRNKSQHLTGREKDVLQHLSKGLSNKEIADELYLSVATIQNYRNRLLDKTETHNTASLILYAREKGWIE